MVLRNIRDLRLSDLKNGEEGIIIKVVGHGAFRKRITEMGFVKGKKVKVIKSAPLQDPVEYLIMDYNVSLRRSEAALIEVVAADIEYAGTDLKFEGVIDEETLKYTAGEKGRKINVALVGNPNCGKTTLFNFASGSHERVGNYGGVTVDALESTFTQSEYAFNIVDLPGTYSITEYTPEELYVRRYIMNNTPDVVINVIDASNLERNLYLTTQLIDMNIKVVIALNMSDELKKRGAVLDIAILGKMIGIPIIPTVASKGEGIKELFDKIIEVYEDKDPVVRHVHINYGQDLERAILNIQKLIKENVIITDRYSSRYLSIKLLEKDKATLDLIASVNNIELIKLQVETEIKKLEKEYSEKSGTIITDAKYGFIAGALGETYLPGKGESHIKTRRIDWFLTHKYLGFPIFIFFMWLMFQVTFSAGKYPMHLIDTFVKWVGNVITNNMATGPLRDLIVDGILGGAGGVLIFLPNILILFFFMSFMEDTGYMARASFIMDKLMHKIGLHGKSFIPLLMGFGCNVPAIMATRTLENRKDRILTMMIIPFMSCSARLPVYVLLISAFFPNWQGLVLVSIYLIGVLLAILVALVLKKLVFAKEDVPFVMELPPYRIPTVRNTSLHMWHKGVQYIKKMGTVILLASIIIWALGYYPQKRASASTKEDSYIGQIGHFIEPAIRPLGFDWKVGVSLITGLAAKEIVISTMGVLYQPAAGDKIESYSLQNKLKEQVYTSGKLQGKPVFTPLTAYGFMLFILIYSPCIASIAAIKRESDWKWATFSLVYSTALAWVVVFLTYNIGRLFI